ncbi:MarR family transcriptional regulator [Sorangium sp. So ce302]|uniref:MarR family winged helix-turn-helix transcriptional regulator n=1 Tax=unclassified Sorangium TaxID=2621164 RepID=UPI003F5F43DC
MPRSSKTHAVEANELAAFATALYQLVETLRGEHEEAAAMAGLTAPQAMVLTLLSEPASMRQFAERMGCDASNVTGLVDRLEAKGLVVRTVDQADRRVKRIARTPAGDAAVSRFQKELVHASSLAKLSPKARRGLLAALAELRRDREP